jgi:ribonucleotide reductase alpha subunit
MNIHMANPNFAKMGSMHFYAWKKGLKTGMYYLRSNAAVEAIKFTVDKELVREQREADISCSLDNPEECISCSG